jgi:hypothetical protein
MEKNTEAERNKIPISIDKTKQEENDITCSIPLSLEQNEITETVNKDSMIINNSNNFIDYKAAYSQNYKQENNFENSIQSPIVCNINNISFGGINSINNITRKYNM